MTSLSNLDLQCLVLVSCLSWSRHLCYNYHVVMLCLLGSGGLWDYNQIVEVIYLILFYILFLHVLRCNLLLWPSSRLWLQEGVLCYIVGSCLPMSSLSDKNMGPGNVMLILRVKQWCLWLRVTSVAYITHWVLKHLSVALSFQLIVVARNLIPARCSGLDF